MIDDLLEIGVKAARDLKTSSVKHGDVLPPSLVVFRGDAEVAVVMAQGARNEVLRAARLCIGGFEADVLVFTSDTYHSTLPVNPRTGKDWAPNEMADVADHYEGRENGWVSDAIHVMVVNRAGDAVATSVPYQKVSRRRIEWGEPWVMSPDEEKGEHLSGVIPDTLLAYMKEPPLMVSMHSLGVDPQKLFGLSPERARAHADIAVSRLLTEQDCAVILSAVPGSVRQQVFKEARSEGRL